MTCLHPVDKRTLAALRLDDPQRVLDEPRDLRLEIRRGLDAQIEALRAYAERLSGSRRPLDVGPEELRWRVTFWPHPDQDELFDLALRAAREATVRLRSRLHTCGTARSRWRDLACTRRAIQKLLADLSER